MSILNKPPYSLIKPLRIAVVDDHPLVLAGIGQILHQAGHTVVEATQSVDQLPKRLGPLRIDAITIDIGMPGTNGIELTRQIHTALPGVAIVIVTQQTDPAYLRAALLAGALGFVSKQAAGTELIAALAAVTKGRLYISPQVLDTTGGLQEAVGRLLGRRDDVLTPRQQIVLQHIAEGKAMKEIAVAMKISVKTVEFHKKALTDALGVNSTAELTKYALVHGYAFLPA